MKYSIRPVGDFYFLKTNLIKYPILCTNPVTPRITIYSATIYSEKGSTPKIQCTLILFMTPRRYSIRQH